jgi:hypothetical protein
MQDPASELPRTPIPRTWVNKSIRKGETSSPSTDLQSWLAAANHAKREQATTRQQG